MRFFAVKEIVQPESETAEETRTADPPANQVMGEVVRVRVGANRHANSTIGPDLVPVGEAGFIVDFPAERAVDPLTFTGRD